MMSDNARWKVYALMGAVGLVLAFYVVDTVLESEKARNDLSSLYMFGTTTAVLIAASAINFYTAFAFKFGRVDEVVGSMRSAVLIRGGRIAREGARIQLKREYDQDNASLTDDQRNILFIADWRPWVCSRRTFRCVDDNVADVSDKDG